MVHGLATWGMCLNLKAAEKRIRAAWMACCVSCGSIHGEGRSKVDLFWWLRYGRCHVVSGHFVDYLAWWLWVNYSLMAAKKLAWWLWWIKQACRPWRFERMLSLLLCALLFLLVFFCVCLFVFHGRVPLCKDLSVKLRCFPVHATCVWGEVSLM